MSTRSYIVNVLPIVCVLLVCRRICFCLLLRFESRHSVCVCQGRCICSSPCFSAAVVESLSCVTLFGGSAFPCYADRGFSRLSGVTESRIFIIKSAALSADRVGYLHCCFALVYLIGTLNLLSSRSGIVLCCNSANISNNTNHS